MFGQYYQPYQVQDYRQPAQDERIWVQGLGAAQAYLVAPNGFARLWDSTDSVFYEKSADHTGRPRIDVYRYQLDDATRAINAKTSDNDIDVRLKAIEDRLKALEGTEHDEPNADA